MEKPNDKVPKSPVFDILTIAYRQTRKMTGGCNNKFNSHEERKTRFECINRIKNISMINEVTSGISSVYKSLKKSNSTVQSILNRTERQINEGLRIISPVTNRIGNILNQPLKSIDSVICNGFDYLGEKVPQLKNESRELYQTVGKRIKSASVSAITYTNLISTSIERKLVKDKNYKSDDSNESKKD